MKMELKSKELPKETMREKVKNTFYKKVTATGLLLLFSLAPMLANTKTAEAYDSGTHRQASSDGFISIGNDKGTNIQGYFREDNMIQTIMDYSIMPDFDENLAGHYYDPATGKNYQGDKITTANTRFCDHYNNAVAQYKQGNKNLAAQELGRSIHYFLDLNQPQHAANLPAIGGPRIVSGAHLDYELWVERKRLNYARTSTPESIYDYVLNHNVWQIGHEAAVNAKNNVGYIRNTYYELDDRNKRNATINTLPRAEQYSAAIMYKFLHDVGKV